MKIPMLMIIKIRNREHQAIRLYILLIFIYLLLLLPIITGALVYAAMMLSPEQTKGPRSGLKILFHTPHLIRTAIGLELNIHSNESDISILVK